MFTVSSNHCYDTRQSQVDNLFVKSACTRQYVIGSQLQNFGILYLLMLKESSRFPVFVNTSRIRSVIDGEKIIVDSKYDQNNLN